MLVWFATNINFLYYQEILAFQQLQFLKKIFTYKTINKALIMEEYLKCIKISHNKRNLLPQEQQKFETNAALTIILGYLIATQITELPKMDMLEKIVSQFGFRNELERTTVFNNTMQILFDLPTMNYYFLNYLKVRCDNNHQECLQNYLAHLSTAQTVSFDKYMLTLQLSVLFGQIDAYMQQIQVEMAKQFQDFLNFKNLIKRRLIILVDILDNPFYCMNVLCHAQVDFPGKQELEQKIFKDAAICILRFNELMTFQQLEDILKLFVYIQGIPQYIKDLVEQSPDGKIKLKDQYSQNWPYMILQKDLISVFQYLQKIEDPFEELLNSSPFFPFLFDIRAKLFLSEPFIEMVKLILGSPYRMELYVWIGKLLYYGKQQLLKKGASLFETLLATAECQSFIQSQEEKHPKLVQYLRS